MVLKVDRKVVVFLLEVDMPLSDFFLLIQFHLKVFKFCFVVWLFHDLLLLVILRPKKICFFLFYDYSEHVFLIISTALLVSFAARLCLINFVEHSNCFFVFKQLRMTEYVARLIFFCFALHSLFVLFCWCLVFGLDFKHLKLLLYIVEDASCSVRYYFQVPRKFHYVYLFEFSLMFNTVFAFSISS